MNSLVVYFSKFGNTKLVAEAVAETLSTGGAARVISSEDLDHSDLENLDLMIMGCPTHRMNLPEALRPWFDRFPRRILRGAATAVFDTSYKMSPWLARFTAAPRLAGKLRKLGGKKVIAPETFYVVERQGPLYEGEIERAQSWASSILRRVQERAHNQ
jgi:flavodoxin